MNVKQLAIPEVVLLEPTIFADNRGFFFESFNQRKFEAAIGQSINFVQDNHSYSSKDVIRGLHYQLNQPQGKLVRVISGTIFDVAVDLRKSSPTFGQWVAEELSSINKKQLWVPAGFAHGFVVLSKEAEVLYKTTDYWKSEDERCIRWDSASVLWPKIANPSLSAKDLQGSAFEEAAFFD